MLKSLRLQNFKCFEDQQIPLSSLTLLAGINGMGKSSVMQSLLLIRQSILQKMLPGKGLLLNGPSVSLGTAKDVFFENAQDDKLGIEVLGADFDANWDFSYGDPFADVMPVVTEPNWDVEQISLASREFHFLTAERLGPRNIHESSSYQVDEQHDLGFDGRYAIAFLEKYGKDKVAPELQHAKAVDDTAISNVVAWLGEIAPGVLIRIQPFLELRNLTLRFGFEKGRKQTSPYTAKNVGFGLSYVLPVLVALIATPRDSIVLIENPEAHLHPRAQTAMGRLISLASQAGVQVIVETHSDHLLNGIRLSAKSGEIVSDSVTLCYFSRTEGNTGLKHFVQHPKLEQNGRIQNWPLGFFDEWENSLDALLG